MFDKPYNPQQTEDYIYSLWEKSGFFSPENLPGKREKSFCMTVPPPNITGSLHMGHALNATIQDILIRKKRMEGYRALWLPGVDHAGIATQNVVEKELKKEGITRHDLGREKFVEKIWEWKEKYGDIILNQFKKLGASLDWSRLRFTMDEDYQKAVQRAFIHYYEQGWLYRAKRVINWCPRCQTALSDLELEYAPEKSKLYYLKYPLKSGGGFVTVATTRPETMLGDSAVAVNPKDPRYQKLVGETLILPLQNREIPVIADAAIDAAFGTGAVKVTPAHDLTDAEMGERHKLPVYEIINEIGRMTHEVGTDFAGLKAKEARELVVEKLREAELLEKEEDYEHNVAACYRCGGVIEPRPSLQWFLKMSELAKKAVEEVERDRVKFHPDSWKNIYLNWLKNIRDWNISRQIWWGHQIPIYYCKQEFDSEKLKVKSEKEFVVAEEKPKKCPFCGQCEMEQDPDVLDTWFSSALWPFATLGWPEKTGDLKNFYPTQTLSTARDIINLWVARMVFSGVEFIGKKPFGDVIIHATVLAKDGRRMSKSLGTGVDPIGLIEKYGADATRFALIWQAMGTQDIKWDETALSAGKKFANKLWNIARFCVNKNENKRLTIDDLMPKKEEDKKILEKLKEIKKTVSEKIDVYEFGPALHELYDFIWHDFADKYIEESKKRADEEAKQVLLKVLKESLKLLHPFMPFVTEAIWQEAVADGGLLMVEKW